MNTADLCELRHRLHAAAEIGLDLPRTQRLVLGALEGLDLEITTGSFLSSVIAVLRGSSSDRSVLLRADMDALPVAEQTDLPYRAAGEVMHACGHDMHMAMLIGAAHLLAERRDRLVGDVVLMFQPGEEGHNGAAEMLAEGLLDVTGSPPAAAYAVHVLSAMLPHGVFATRPGPLLAAADGVKFTIHGRGGHGSTPHRAADPVVVAAAIVTALQVMVTREFDVFDPVVLTVGSIHAGAAHNVIPESAYLEATLRSFTPESRSRLMAAASRICKGIADAHGMSVTVAATPAFPVTTNNGDEARHCLGVAADLFGTDRTATLGTPLMGSEDFSLVLDQVPGAMVLIGACPPDQDPATAPFNHSAGAQFDDALLGDGAAFLAELAISKMRRARQPDPQASE